VGELDADSSEARHFIQSQNESSPAPAKKRRPRTNMRDIGEWSFYETKRLCELWSHEPVLYDPKHPKHYLKDNRDEAISKIADVLIEEGSSITDIQVTSKMSSLRAYYSGQLSKEKKSKGSATPYQSQWRFMECLSFLNDAIVPRVKMTRLPTGSTEPATAHVDASHATRQSVQRTGTTSTQQNNGIGCGGGDYYSETESNHGMEGRVEATSLPSPAKTAYATSNNNGYDKQPKSQLQNADESFCDIIRNLLIAIPEGEVKDMLKLKIHQQVLEAKYKVLDS